MDPINVADYIGAEAASEHQRLQKLVKEIIKRRYRDDPTFDYIEVGTGPDGKPVMGLPMNCEALRNWSGITEDEIRILDEFEPVGRLFTERYLASFEAAD